jgi:hypothetical protein
VLDEELAELYAACDALFFLADNMGSRYRSHGSLKPVIVSQVWCFRNHSKRRKRVSDGWVKPINMALQIEKLIADSELRKKMALALYEFTKENLSGNLRENMETFSMIQSKGFEER